jgi:1,2-diacylglycerol 3-beta-glucosyltransferase
MHILLIGIGFAGLAFSFWAEMLFALVMFALCAGFGYCALYLWSLLLAAFTLRRQVVALSPSNQDAGKREKGKGKSSNPTPNAQRPHQFVLLIPAHNEELLLGAALDSLQQLDYPRTDYEIVVIADNCSDKTAEIARAHGAVALERFNTDLIGKGYALEWALQRLLDPADNSNTEAAARRDFDAIVILDADTQVSPNLLTAFARGIDSGHAVMQARYDVLNVGESWRTKLMTCALALAHVVKPLGRERLGLSDGLKGNGMCFAREVVVTVPWSGASITEDIEYTLRLCRAGYRVAFLPEAGVWAQMPTTSAQATSQRKRWEGGRYSLLFTVAPGLWSEGVRRKSRLLRDRAMEIIIPPFAEMFALPLLLLLLCAGAARLFHWTWAAGFAWAWAAILILQGGYLLGGMLVARVPASVALSLLYAPVYILWKFGVYAVMAVTRSAGGWKRTERHQLQEDSTSGS